MPAYSIRGQSAEQCKNTGPGPGSQGSRDCRRGEIYYILPAGASGSEQAGRRPAVIVSNDIGNRHSTIAEVVFLTTREKNSLPTHVRVRAAPYPSIALCEQIQTVSKGRIGRYVGKVSDYEMEQINKAMLISLGLQKPPRKGRKPKGGKGAGGKSGPA